MDPNVYLADGFEISKLTVSNLKAILAEHEVFFPSSSNKSQLIEIFNSTIKPNAEQILKKYKDEPSPKEVVDIAQNQINQQDKLLEPLELSDSDKTIPSKRTINESPKKPRRKLRKNNNNTSFSDSSTTSFLAIEKFEIDENDDIFNGPIDNTPIKLLGKTNFSKEKHKPSTEAILSNYDSSVPSSKVFKSDKIPLSTGNSARDNFAHGVRPSNNASLESLSNESDRNISNENIISSDLLNKQFMGIDHNTETDNSFNPNEHYNIPILENNQGEKSSILLKGPTNSINHTMVSIVGSEVEGDDGEEVEIIQEKADELLVSTLEVKSLSTFETDISFSDDSVEISFKQKSEERREEKEEEEEEEEEEEGQVKKQAEEQLEVVDAEQKSIPETETKELCETKNGERTKTEEPDSTGPIKDNKKNSSICVLVLNIFITLFSIVTVMIPLGILFCLREMKMNTGYCGIESPVKLLDIWGKIPSSLHKSFLPMRPAIEHFETFMSDSSPFQCEQCPSNGVCDSNSLSCDYLYVNHYPLKSLYGLIPLQETCEFDSLREEKMRYLSEYTLNYLHRHNEKMLTLEELHDYLSSTKNSKISNNEFQDYWKNFIKYEVSNSPVLTINHNTNEITLSHKTPVEYYTRSFGNIERSKKSKKLFEKTPPTIDLKNYYTKSE